MKQAIIFLLLFLVLKDNSNGQSFTGPVGIGTTSPATQLEVASANGGSIRFGGANGRTLIAVQNGALSNFDFEAVATYYSGHLLVNGTVSSPWGSTQNLHLTTGGTNAAIYTDRKLLIQTTTNGQDAPLEVRGSMSTGMIQAVNGPVKMGLGIGPQSQTGQVGTYTNHPLRLIVNDNSAMQIETSGNIWMGGNVAIGTTDPQGYRLAVNGDAIFVKVKVKPFSGWPDYVFESNYKLLTLSEVEKFIKANHHLPRVPSAAAVKENGLDLGDGQAALLEKIEELTLYLIEQNKKVELLQKEVEKLKSKK